MLEVGVSAADIRAAIGPCIHKCCYEVSRDVYDAVKDGLGADFAERFVTPTSIEGKYMCDLAGINRELLLNCGLQEEGVDVLEECTCCQPEKFFSHRYSHGVRGTMLSVISMR
jgi:copper oxidase (laccase) domain-containing protein